MTTRAKPASEPWYASVSFWTDPFTFVLGLLVAVGIGVAWYMLGGLPRDHDTYGSVSVPGQQVLQLPEGDVRVNFENDTIGSGDTRSIRDRPQGLAVRILPAAGGEEIEVNDVPNWLFSSITNDRGPSPLAGSRSPAPGATRFGSPPTTPTGSTRRRSTCPLRRPAPGPKSRLVSAPGRRSTRFSWARSSPGSRSFSRSSC
jgi:hypothetical protein